MPPQISQVTKIKAQLKLAIARLRMVQQRDESTSKAARRSMAQLLEAGKIDSARIRVENIIRADILTELHEILELYCELLLARAGLLDAPVCDPGLEEAAKSIIFAAPKTEIKELQAVRLLLGEKYGKDFVNAAMENTDGAVSDKVVKKLRVAPPREELVQGYLEEISRAYGVDWPPRRSKTEAAVPDGEPPEYCDDDITKRGDEDDGADGGIKESIEADEPGPVTATPSKSASRIQDNLLRATPPRNLGAPSSPLTVTPPRMTTDNIHPKVTLNSMELKPKKMEAAVPKKATGSGDAKRSGGGSGVEDLERRFAALRGVGP